MAKLNFRKKKVRARTKDLAKGLVKHVQEIPDRKGTPKSQRRGFASKINCSEKTGAKSGESSHKLY